MSIKHFHHVIIFAAFLAALGFAGWCFLDSSVSASLDYEVAGIGSLLIAAALVVYEVAYFKKVRKIYIN